MTMHTHTYTQQAIDMFRGGAGASQCASAHIRWACETVACVLYVPYEFANNVLWLRSIGFIAKEGRLRSRAKDVALKCRVVAAAARLVRAFLDLRDDRDEPPDNSGQDGIAPASRPCPRRVALVWALAATVGDVGVYAQRSGLVAAVTGVELSQGFVGACGVLGSVAGAVPLVVAACTAISRTDVNTT